MAFLGSLFCFFGFMLSYARDRSFYSPTVLFALFWTLLLLLSGFQFYGIYAASFTAISLIVIGVVCFLVGGCFVWKQNNSTKYNYELNEQVYNIAVIICFCGLFLNISFLFAFASSGFDINYIYTIMASIAGGEETELSDLYDPKLLILQQFIGYPLLYTIVPISIVEYVSTKRKKYLIIAISLSLIRFLFDFRRTYIVIIIVFLLFVFLIRRTELIKNKSLNNIKKLGFRKKLLIGVSVIAIIFIFTLISSARRGDNESDEYSLASNFYYYYVGSIPYFSLRLDSIPNINYTLGFTSFRGLISPFIALVGFLGINKPYLMELANQNVASLHDTVLNITNTHPFNSYATCFFEFYLDGGIIGVIVISLIFGFYAQSLYADVRTNKSNRFTVKYALFVSIFLYLSVLHFNGVVVCYIWPFILERFFYKRNIIPSSRS